MIFSGFIIYSEIKRREMWEIVFYNSFCQFCLHQFSNGFLEQKGITTNWIARFEVNKAKFGIKSDFSNHVPTNENRKQFNDLIVRFVQIKLDFAVDVNEQRIN